MEQKHICISCMAPLEPGMDVCPECGYNQHTHRSPLAILPGTILQERYFVGKVLSANGEGICYVAYDMVADCRVELREFFPGNLCLRDNATNNVMPSVGSESRFKTLMMDFVELAKTLTRSRSLTAIIPVLDVFEDNNTVYMVSQYVETITLKDYLLRQGGEISWETCKAMFTPVISALNTIHSTVSQNHLGITPETILVDKNEQLKLSGFSIEALRVGKSDIIPELAAGYSAPEQYNSTNWIGPWTDVYALAAVMYKCLTGTMPPESSGRIMGETLVPANKLNKSVPINISNVLFKAMSISPEKRIQSVEDFIIAITEKADFEVQPTQNNQTTDKKQLYIICSVIGVCAVIAIILLMIIFPMINGSNDPNSGLIDVSGSSEISSEVSGEESSNEAKPTTLKDYVGQKYNDVEKELTAIANITVKQVFSEKEAKGTIIKQSLEKGTEVLSTTSLTITVSKGPEFYSYAGLTGNTKTWVFVHAQLISAGVDEARITVLYDPTDNRDIDGTVASIETIEDGTIALGEEDPITVHVSKFGAEEISDEESGEESSAGIE